MTTIVPPLLTGSLFGASLLAATVHTPTIILDQLSLNSAHMLKVFLTASSISALIIYVSNRTRFANLPIRTNTSYGWFGAYDANIVGGLLQGLGMALSGACPGTVLVQVALGRRVAPWIVAGGILGALTFVFGAEKVKRKGRVAVTPKHTVAERLYARQEAVVLGYQALLIAVIVGVDRLGLSRKGEWTWLGSIQGGIVVGLAQAASVLFARKTLGVSSAYADLAAHVKSVVNGKGLGSNYGNLLFAAGVIGGARLAGQYIPSGTIEALPEIGRGTALVSGFCSILGARLAGGCTSGHGISGMSTLSISSFVTVACMFGGGMLFNSILGSW